LSANGLPVYPGGLLVVVPSFELMMELAVLNHELITFDAELRTLDVAFVVPLDVVWVAVVVVPVG
jgi:hypothetical protein